ncbi:MAG: PEP-utilizing enzyme [Patescibacteria group bacterium]
MRHFNLKKDDYILSFWVQGVSVFVTDIHREAYKKLEALFIIDHGMFKQYFTKKAFERALNTGLEFYSDEKAFDNYQRDLSDFCDKFEIFFEHNIKRQSTLSEENVLKFFEYTKTLCGDYTLMNFESTDRAFAEQEKNSVLKKNLVKAAKFKDKVRTLMNTVLFEYDGYSSRFFQILGKQFDFSLSMFENMTQGEILDLFRGIKPDEAKISKRQEAFAESFDAEEPFEGEDAEIILKEFRDEYTDNDIIKGQIASQGKAIGKVKIIPVDYGDLGRIGAEIHAMEQGDILVAETTAPELIMACKKAGAIVTDIGGLMSHAAIVSRELGIPCIVGTKIATKILKDGDMVEVDANTGIVKIISK